MFITDLQSRNYAIKSTHILKITQSSIFENKKGAKPKDSAPLKYQLKPTHQS